MTQIDPLLSVGNGSLRGGQRTPDLSLAPNMTYHPGKVCPSVAILLRALPSALGGCITHGISALAERHAANEIASEWDEINRDETSTRNPRSADSHQDLQDR
jgi:hypothetical protein